MLSTNKSLDNRIEPSKFMQVTTKKKRSNHE